MLDFLLVGGIAFGLAYWITRTGFDSWRAIAGALLGFIVGWVGGIAILAFVSYLGDFGLNSFDKLIGRSFWWALIGSGYGAHRAKKELGNSPIVDAQENPKVSHALHALHAPQAPEFHPPFADTTSKPPGKSEAAAPKVFTFRNESENIAPKRPPTAPPIGNNAGAPQVSTVGAIPDDAYAEAMAEIEEVRIDKGTWARCYALSDGDESKAKAAYIKARAQVLGAAPIWANTRPNELDGADADTTGTTSKTGGGTVVSTNPFPKWLVRSAIGLVLFGVWLAVALPAYQDYSKRLAMARQVETPAPQETTGKYGENDTLVSPAPPVDRSKFEPVPSPEKQIATPQLTPFTGTLDNFDPSTARPVDTVEAHFKRIDAAHPDAESIVISSDFSSWVAKNPSYRPIFAKGTSQEVIDMLTAYKKQR